MSKKIELENKEPSFCDAVKLELGDAMHKTCT